MKLLYQEQKRLIEIRDTLHQSGKIKQQAQSDLEVVVGMIAYIKRQYPRVKNLDIVKNHLLSFQK